MIETQNIENNQWANFKFTKDDESDYGRYLICKQFETINTAADWSPRSPLTSDECYPALDSEESKFYGDSATHFASEGRVLPLGKYFVFVQSCTDYPTPDTSACGGYSWGVYEQKEKNPDPQVQADALQMQTAEQEACATTEQVRLFSEQYLRDHPGATDLANVVAQNFSNVGSSLLCQIVLNDDIAAEVQNPESPTPPVTPAVTIPTVGAPGPTTSTIPTGGVPGPTTSTTPTEGAPGPTTSTIPTVGVTGPTTSTTPTEGAPGPTTSVVGESGPTGATGPTSSPTPSPSNPEDPESLVSINDDESGGSKGKGIAMIVSGSVLMAVGTGLIFKGFTQAMAAYRKATQAQKTVDDETTKIEGLTEAVDTKQEELKQVPDDNVQKKLDLQTEIADFDESIKQLTLDLEFHQTQLKNANEELDTQLNRIENETNEKTTQLDKLNENFTTKLTELTKSNLQLEAETKVLAEKQQTLEVQRSKLAELKTSLATQRTAAAQPNTLESEKVALVDAETAHTKALAELETQRNLLVEKQNELKAKAVQDPNLKALVNSADAGHQKAVVDAQVTAVTPGPDLRALKAELRDTLNLNNQKILEHRLNIAAGDLVIETLNEQTKALSDQETALKAEEQKLNQQDAGGKATSEQQATKRAELEEFVNNNKGIPEQLKQKIAEIETITKQINALETQNTSAKAANEAHQKSIKEYNSRIEVDLVEEIKKLAKTKTDNVKDPHRPLINDTDVFFKKIEGRIVSVKIGPIPAVKIGANGQITFTNDLIFALKTRGASIEQLSATKTALENTVPSKTAPNPAVPNQKIKQLKIQLGGAEAAKKTLATQETELKTKQAELNALPPDTPPNTQQARQKLETNKQALKKSKESLNELLKNQFIELASDNASIKQLTLSDADIENKIAENDKAILELEDAKQKADAEELATKKLTQELETQKAQLEEQKRLAQTSEEPDLTRKIAEIDAKKIALAAESSTRKPQPADIESKLSALNTDQKNLKSSESRYKKLTALVTSMSNDINSKLAAQAEAQAQNQLKKQTLEDHSKKVIAEKQTLLTELTNKRTDINGKRTQFTEAQTTRISDLQRQIKTQTEGLEQLKKRPIDLDSSPVLKKPLEVDTASSKVLTGAPTPKVSTFNTKAPTRLDGIKAGFKAGGGAIFMGVAMGVGGALLTTYGSSELDSAGLADAPNEYSDQELYFNAIRDFEISIRKAMVKRHEAKAKLFNYLSQHAKE